MKLSLKAARVNANLTQKEVAKRLGVSEKTLWSWENGKTFPSPMHIDALCSIYLLSYDNIIFLQTENGKTVI